MDRFFDTDSIVKSTPESREIKEIEEVFKVYNKRGYEAVFKHKPEMRKLFLETNDQVRSSRKIISIFYSLNTSHNDSFAFSLITKEKYEIALYSSRGEEINKVSVGRLVMTIYFLPRGEVLAIDMFNQGFIYSPDLSDVLSVVDFTPLLGTGYLLGDEKGIFLAGYSREICSTGMYTYIKFFIPFSHRYQTGTN